MAVFVSPNTIGVVVVNWNGFRDTLECLESLRVALPRAGRVFVVDNGSTDDSVVRILDWAQSVGENATSANGECDASQTAWLVIVRAGRNLGFAGGNNVGLRCLRADPQITHFLLLNNDATVAADFFAKIVDAARARPDAGLIGATIYEHPNRDKVWYAGGREIRGRALIAHLERVPDAAIPVETEFVTGCAMLISRQTMQQIGPLAECYFPLYMEDAEYSLRARRAGLPAVFAPKARVYHKVGATVGKAETSPVVTRAQVRHRILYVRRNFPPLQRAVALAYLAITKPGKAVIETARGKPRQGWATLTGLFQGFAHRV